MKKQLHLVASLLFIVACTSNSPADETSKSDRFSDSIVNKAIKILEKEDVEYAYPHWSNDGKKIVFNRQINGEKNTIGIYILNL